MKYVDTCLLEKVNRGKVWRLRDFERGGGNRGYGTYV